MNLRLVHSPRHSVLALLLLLQSCLLNAADDSFNFDFSEMENADSPWSWGGFIDFRHQYANSRSTVFSNRLRLQMEGSYQQGAWLFLSSFRAEYDPETHKYRDTSRIEWHEVYAVFDAENTDFSIGKRRVAWGVADGRSTIDRVNAIDFRDPVSNGRTSNRLPSWVVLLKQNTEWGIWEAVWLPIGRDRQFAKFGSPWENTTLNALRRQAIRDNKVFDIENTKNHEAGLRFNRYGLGLDWGFAVFDGYTDAPLILTGDDYRISLHAARIRTWNANMAVGFMAGTLRGELSYTDDFPLAYDLGDRLVQVIFGWDRTYFTSLYLNVQAYWDDLDGAEENYGITFALSNQFFNGTLEIGTRGLLGVRSQYSQELFIDYRFSDHILTSLKVQVFEGDVGTEIGEFEANNFIEWLWRYDF